MNSTAHLYTVDANGVAEPPTAGGAGSSGSTGSGGGAPRKHTKARPKYPVPTDRMKHSSAVDALRAFCALSKGGTESVTTAQLASNLGLSPVTAGLNNVFFASLGLLEQAGKGSYKPTELALAFYRKYTFDRAEAPPILAPAFRDQWFFEAVKHRLDVKPESTKSQVIEVLAAAAGTDASYSVQYGQLLEWLEYVGLIKIDNGVVRVLEAGTVSVKPVNDGKKPTPLGEEGVVTPPVGEGERPTEIAGSAAPPVVSLSVEINVTAEDLVKLTADQITALFDGIGKVASVKAALQ